MSASENFELTAATTDHAKQPKKTNISYKCNKQMTGTGRNKYIIASSSQFTTGLRDD